MYRGVFEAAESFMATWHSDEAGSSWLRYAAADAKSGDKEKGGWARGGMRTESLLSTKAETKWWIVSQGSGSTNMRNLSCHETTRES